MANTYAPLGAQDEGHVGGSQRTEELERCWIPSSHSAPIFNGDLVVSWGSSAATGGFANYIGQGSSLSAAATRFRGVFRGCKYYNSALQRPVLSKHFPGATLAGTTSATGDVEAWIVSDPTQQFLLQCSTAITALSSYIGFIVNVGGAGSTAFDSSAVGNYTTGYSGMCAGSFTVGVGSSSPVFGAFKFVDFYSNRAPGNWMQSPAFGSAGSFVNLALHATDVKCASNQNAGNC